MAGKPKSSQPAPQAQLPKWIPVAVILFFTALFRPRNIPDILLGLRSRDHYHMPAAPAFQPEIDTRPEDLPFTAAAGMGFFHFNDVADPYVHSFISANDRLCLCQKSSVRAVRNIGLVQAAPAVGKARVNVL